MNWRHNFLWCRIGKVVEKNWLLIFSYTYLHSESKRMTITIVHFTTISGHFSANRMFIFHKKEVQTVILRCLTGLNIDGLKNYGPRCKWRHRACLASFQNIATDKWTFYYHIWPFFSQVYGYLSQKWDSDGHFEVLKGSKYWLVQELWPQM